MRTWCHEANNNREEEERGRRGLRWAINLSAPWRRRSSTISIIPFSVAKQRGEEVLEEWPKSRLPFSITRLLLCNTVSKEMEKEREKERERERESFTFVTITSGNLKLRLLLQVCDFDLRCGKLHYLLLVLVHLCSCPQQHPDSIDSIVLLHPMFCITMETETEINSSLLSWSFLYFLVSRFMFNFFLPLSFPLFALAAALSSSSNLIYHFEDVLQDVEMWFHPFLSRFFVLFTLFVVVWFDVLNLWFCASSCLPLPVTAFGTIFSTISPFVLLFFSYFQKYKLCDAVCSL